MTATAVTDRIDAMWSATDQWTTDQIADEVLALAAETGTSDLVSAIGSRALNSGGFNPHQHGVALVLAQLTLHVEYGRLGVDQEIIDGRLGSIETISFTRTDDGYCMTIGFETEGDDG